MSDTATSRRRRLPLGDERGFTLVEVIVAAVLLAVLSTAALGILFAAQRSSVNDRNRVAATNLAARELDIVRQQFNASVDGPRRLADEGSVTNPHPLAGGTAGSPLVVDSVGYTVTRSSRWSLTGTGSSACEGGSLVRYPTLIVTTRVTWPNMGSVRPVTNSTVLAPTKASSLSTVASYVAVSVVDATGAGNAGIPVTVTSGSETRTGLTDTSGCATVPVTPPAGGAEYTVSLHAAGHVDVAGVAEPSKSVGTVQQGQLIAVTPMTYDRSGSLTVQVTGAGVTAEDVAGMELSIYSSQNTGSTSVVQQPLTGLTMQLTDLWPAKYGAYLGSTQPADLPLAEVPAGGAATLTVAYAFAQFTVTDAPPGGTVLAVPADDTSGCSSPRARTVDPTAGSLPPGNWSFFAQGAAFGCAQGPGDIPLEPGPNPALAWAASTLQLTNVPTGAGAIWAVSATAATGSCQVPSPASLAVELGDGTAAAVGPVPLPAGDWYVFAAPASGGGPAVGAACPSAGVVTVRYGYPTVQTWETPQVEVRVTGVALARYLVAAPSTISCQRLGSTYYYSYRVDGATQNRTDSWGSPSPTTRSSTTVTGNLPQGTWKIYEWSKSGWMGSCSFRGTVVVGVNGPLTLNGAGSNNSVGP
ncbi:MULTISPECIES: type II secretion system protein [unclassified Modestobacter]|uniref:type II secretion system protein n=1 Tax=unclassified Modestobacter TaxID=2643866 RepID=UPI0022AAC099|nr:MULTISPECIES: type II secretion system protein [unclassified Modestobacter]MCZ2824682.1 type II secretion system protein [Modestobacter sp. VKM Ac-2981]MCZ2854815.1 type II secretion system protein [Modestobacter sp. VKM Ac-2982]